MITVRYLEQWALSWQSFLQLQYDAPSSVRTDVTCEGRYRSFANCMRVQCCYLQVSWELMDQSRCGQFRCVSGCSFWYINRLTPNDTYMGRTAPLTSKRCILYIYSTNMGTEYFKHALYCPFFPLQNAVCFIMLTCLVPVLLTFYIQGVLKLKKIIPAPKG